MLTNDCSLKTLWAEVNELQHLFHSLAQQVGVRLFLVSISGGKDILIPIYIVLVAVAIG